MQRDSCSDEKYNKNLNNKATNPFHKNKSVPKNETDFVWNSNCIAILQIRFSLQADAHGL